MMNLDELLTQVRDRRLILISESEVWPSPLFTRALQRAIRKHRSALALLIRWSTIDVCPSRDLHRQYYRYASHGEYVCGMCQQLDKYLHSKQRVS